MLNIISNCIDFCNVKAALKGGTQFLKPAAKVSPPFWPCKKINHSQHEQW